MHSTITVEKTFLCSTVLPYGIYAAWYCGQDIQWYWGARGLFSWVLTRVSPLTPSSGLSCSLHLHPLWEAAAVLHLGAILWMPQNLHLPGDNLLQGKKVSVITTPGDRIGLMSSAEIAPGEFSCYKDDTLQLGAYLNGH